MYHLKLSYKMPVVFMSFWDMLILYKRKKKKEVCSESSLSARGRRCDTHMTHQ